MTVIPPQVMLTKELGISDGKEVHAEMVSQKQKKQAELAGMALGAQRQEADMLSGGPTPLEAEARRAELDRLSEDVIFEANMWRQQRAIQRNAEEFDQNMQAKRNAFQEYLLKQYDIAGRQGQMVQGQQLLQDWLSQNSPGGSGAVSDTNRLQSGGRELTPFERDALAEYQNTARRVTTDSAYSTEQLTNQDIGTVIVAQGIILEMMTAGKIAPEAVGNWLHDPELKTNPERFWGRFTNQVPGVPLSYPQLLESGASIKDQVAG